MKNNTYKERLKLEFKENSMLYKFYLYIFKKKKLKGGYKNNGKEIKEKNKDN